MSTSLWEKGREKEERERGAREREANVSMERKERALSSVPCDMS